LIRVSEVRALRGKVRERQGGWGCKTMRAAAFGSVAKVEEWREVGG